MAELLGLELGHNGTDIHFFAELFADGTGSHFFAAAARSFLSAEREMKASTTKEEIWDRVAQNDLAARCDAEKILIPDAELLLEKGHGGKVVWNYGVRVYRGQKGRGWTLPDGLIRRGTEVYALEFDHGNTVGRWARQLVKAMRLAASPSIDGVLFCYWTPKDHRQWFTDIEFTPEFKAVVEAGIGQKRVGILTIGAPDVQAFTRE